MTSLTGNPVCPLYRYCYLLLMFTFEQNIYFIIVMSHIKPTLKYLNIIFLQNNILKSVK